MSNDELKETILNFIKEVMNSKSKENSYHKSLPKTVQLSDCLDILNEIRKRFDYDTKEEFKSFDVSFGISIRDKEYDRVNMVIKRVVPFMATTDRKIHPRRVRATS